MINGKNDQLSNNNLVIKIINLNANRMIKESLKWCIWALLFVFYLDVW